MKTIRKEIQEKIKQLRHKGKSHREIARILNVGLGTAFYYSRGIRLTHKQHRHLIIQGYNKSFGKLTKKERHLASVKGGVNNAKNLIPKYSRVQLLQFLKDFYIENGRIPTKRDFINHYGSFFRTFGTWNKAIQEAGFPPNPVLFAKKYIANDGHKCDSLAEKIIDDWFYARQIPHERNIKYPNTRFTADFKVRNFIIEFFGLHGELQSYDKLMKRKLAKIRSLGWQLISIYPKDIFPQSQLNVVLKDFL